MMLGYPASGSLDIVQPFSSPQIYLGLFVQDNIRVSKRLTVNVGLRWDVETARTERYNRLSYFDPTVASPLAAHRHSQPGRRTAIPGRGRKFQPAAE